MRRQALLLLLFAFLPGPVRAAAPDVLATIKPVHALVAAVMDGVGTPALLIGGADSAHSYVMKPSDAGKLAAAKVVFWIGPDLETFLISPLANLAAGAHVVALEHVPGLDLLAARRGGLWTEAPRHVTGGNINPHIWLDPDNAIAMTRAIARTLSQVDPEHASAYRRNAAKEEARIAALDREIAKRLAPVRNRPYIVFHDAYAYFDAHYHLAAIGAVTVEPGRPVGPRRIATLRDAIKHGRAVCIFREPEFSPAVIRTLAAGTAVRIGVLDPLGAALAPGPQLYRELLTRLTGALTRCLAK